MAKHVSELTVEELSELGNAAAQDAARESLEAGLTPIGAFPDGTLYSVDSQGNPRVLSEEEILRLRQAVAQRAMQQSRRLVP